MSGKQGAGKAQTLIDDGARNMAIFTVDSFGDTIDAGDGVTTLREALALAAASAGADTIRFASGGTATLGGTELTLSGELTIDGDATGDGIGDVTIDANGASRVMKAVDGSITLEGLMLTGGVVDGDGGGVLVEREASLSLLRSIVAGNEATQGGGGIHNLGDLTLLESRVSANSARTGGGLDNRGSLELNRSEVSQNTAEAGGGVHSYGEVRDAQEISLVVKDITILNNAALSGGGIFNFGSSEMLIEGSRISDNTASQQSEYTLQSHFAGGGIFSFSERAAIRDSEISGNSAQFGGGVYNARFLEVSDSLIAENAAQSGGGLYAFQDVVVTGTTFSRNTAIEDGGGAYHDHFFSSFMDSTFVENSAGRDGGGLYSLFFSEAKNATFVGNVAGSNGGGIASALSVVATNVTVTGNTASNGGGLYSGGSGIRLTNGIVLGNEATNGAEIFDNPALQSPGTPFEFRSETMLTDSITLGNPEDVFAIVVDGAGILADNGGPVQTVALRDAADNPALDIGRAGGIWEFEGTGFSFDLSIEEDALGNARANDLSGIDNGGRVDAGAVELSAGHPRPSSSRTGEPFVLTGLDATSDTLFGGFHDSILIGRGMGDHLRGGIGRDTASYEDSDIGVLVDRADMSRNTGDAAGDAYFSIEIVRGSAHGDNLRGSGASDRLEGIGGNDVLKGRGGSDHLYGGEGRDRLIGGADGDFLHGGAGFDRADYTGSAGLRADLRSEMVNTGDAAGDRYVGIEALRGTGFADHLRGDEAGNALEGMAGRDVLIGRGGNDRLFGGEGSDVLMGGQGDDFLTGGAGRDHFAFRSAEEGIDTILDFVTGQDRVRLDGGGFASLAEGRLSAENFVRGSTAQDADDFILYDASSGALAYDPDGSGSGAAVQFAVVAGGAMLDSDDFFVL